MKEKEDIQEVLFRAAGMIEDADAIVIGAGAGLSAAAGLTYSGKRFEEHFSDFIHRYGMTDMYSAGFYPFSTPEEKWAYWSRHIYYNRYQPLAGEVYTELYELVKDKNYFVITTNVDHQFWKAGFDGERIFAVQGDYGLFQCAKACHRTLYDNEDAVRRMMDDQKECRISASLIPKCPVCKGEMEVNLRRDEYFVEDESWHQAAGRYEEFLRRCRGLKVLFWELGVGMNTPGIIKYPFWQMTNRWEQASYLNINQGQAWAPDEIREKAICINADIAKVLKSIRTEDQKAQDRGGPHT